MRLAASLDLKAQEQRQAERHRLEQTRADLKEEERRRREMASDPTERRKVRVEPELDIDSFILRPATLPLGPNSSLEMWKVKVSVSWPLQPCIML
jgi:hypothetical protein